MISLEKQMILTPLLKLPNNEGIWVKYLLPSALNACPKSKKSPNLGTLAVAKQVFCQQLSWHTS